MIHRAKDIRENVNWLVLIKMKLRDCSSYDKLQQDLWLFGIFRTRVHNSRDETACDRGCLTIVRLRATSSIVRRLTAMATGPSVNQNFKSTVADICLKSFQAVNYSWILANILRDSNWIFVDVEGRTKGILKKTDFKNRKNSVLFFTFKKV